MNLGRDPTEGQERAKQITLMRAELFFQEVQTALGISSNTRSSSDQAEFTYGFQTDPLPLARRL
jgi:hypothetical protein